VSTLTNKKKESFYKALFFAQWKKVKEGQNSLKNKVERGIVKQIAEGKICQTKK
jgi:hypothetical protein